MYALTTLTTPVFDDGTLPLVPSSLIENAFDPIDTVDGATMLVLSVVDVSNVASAQAGCVTSSSAAVAATTVRTERFNATCATRRTSPVPQPMFLAPRSVRPDAGGDTYFRVPPPKSAPRFSALTSGMTPPER